MWGLLEREVWDCFVPAAIREDIVLPELRKPGSSWDSDDSARSYNRGLTPYQRALRKREKKKAKELGVVKDDGAFAFLTALLLEPEDATEGINPPPIYFEMHKIPKAPSWSDKQVDNDWLPSPPSLAYDDYNISGN
ncbi:unnamed protein product [Cylindrotheca closterium]|uniref:Uncharacterized protein n=1 Tax=Cylindrotheca closterium TaxID=2856 RepID=A0AAD2CCM7_9STRA|nr:unnamed protein product [Cylindrotheca closterium]